MQEYATTRCYHHFTELEQRFIRRWYATARTCCIAHILGLTTTQVEKFAERHAGEPWAKKHPTSLRLVRSCAGKQGGRPHKE